MALERAKVATGETFVIAGTIPGHLTGSICYDWSTTYEGRKNGLFSFTSYTQR
jgi:hypothetical protein